MAIDEATQLSRGGTTGPYGKLDAELPKLRMSVETLGGLQRLAAERGLPLSEYVRLVLDVHVHGVDAVASMAVQRIRSVVGTGA